MESGHRELHALQRPPMKTLTLWVTTFRNHRHTHGGSRMRTVEADTPLRLVCDATTSVTCLSGVAWITTAADTRDVVLQPGQQHVAARKARLFVNGMPRCVLRFESASDSALACLA